MADGNWRETREPANFVGLSRTIAALDAATTAFAAPDRARRAALIAVEELYVNLLHHGLAPGATGEVRVRAAPCPEGVEVCYEDDGAPFDPTASDGSAPDAPGVALIRGLPMRISYARQANRNVVRMTCGG